MKLGLIASIPSIDFEDGDDMTLRDYFAGQALAGLVSDAATLAALEGAPEGPDATIAAGAYNLADAMIAEKRRRDADA